MYPDTTGTILKFLGIVTFVWVGVLTVWFWKYNLLISRLFPSSEGREQSLAGYFSKLEKELERMRKQDEQRLKALQRFALKRYNPYQDTGGSQSFSLALLDGLGDGLVVTSLHSRAGTRVFAKSVKKGKHTDIDFSQEEKDVIVEATK
ncbi:MAG: DUF4446 family protein [Candidatus Daviesbacteria bacterium]|nr:DUF4446 family protein [Candidatus Daviesbacteria bacterium]